MTAQAGPAARGGPKSRWDHDGRTRRIARGRPRRRRLRNRRLRNRRLGGGRPRYRRLSGGWLSGGRLSCGRPHVGRLHCGRLGDRWLGDRWLRRDARPTPGTRLAALARSRRRRVTTMCMGLRGMRLRGMRLPRRTRPPGSTRLTDRTRRAGATTRVGRVDGMAARRGFGSGRRRGRRAIMTARGRLGAGRLRRGARIAARSRLACLTWRLRRRMAAARNGRWPGGLHGRARHARRAVTRRGGGVAARARRLRRRARVGPGGRFAGLAWRMAGARAWFRRSRGRRGAGEVEDRADCAARGVGGVRCRDDAQRLRGRRRHHRRRDTQSGLTCGRLLAHVPKCAVESVARIGPCAARGTPRPGKGVFSGEPQGGAVRDTLFGMDADRVRQRVVPSGGNALGRRQRQEQPGDRTATVLDGLGGGARLRQWHGECGECGAGRNRAPAGPSAHRSPQRSPAWLPGGRRRGAGHRLLFPDDRRE